MENKMKKSSYGYLAKSILKDLAVEAMMFARFAQGSAAFSPANSPMKKMNTKERAKLKQALFGLEKRGFVAIRGSGNDKYIAITEKGKEKIIEYDFYDLEIAKPKKWDGRWRVIVFDIPEINKRKRQQLWWKFKDIGFYLLQKSTYVFPYDCMAEIEMIKDFWGDKGDIIYFVSEIYDQKKGAELKKFFGIKQGGRIKSYS